MQEIKIITVEPGKSIADEISAFDKIYRFIVSGTADSPEKAFNLISRDRPDVVLIDSDCPGLIDSFKTTLALKKKYHVPVILVKEKIEPEDIENARSARYDGYLLKPLHPALLSSSAQISIARQRISVRQLEREQKYKTLIEDINEIIFFLDETGMFTYISPSIAELTGYDPSEVVGSNFAQYIYEKDLKLVVGAYESLKNGKTGQTEYRVNTKDGGFVWVRSFSHPVFLKGQFSGLKGIMIDISVQKRAESELMMSRAQLNTILGSAPVGIGHVINGKLIWMNDTFASMTGFAGTELLNRTLKHLFADPDDYREAVDIGNMKIYEKGVGSISTIWKTAKGDAVHIILSITPLVFEEPDAGVIFTALDISQRIRSEKLIQMQRDLGLKLSTLQNLSEAMRCILNSILSIDDVDCGGIYLIDPEIGNMILAVHDGLSNTFISRTEWYSSDSDRVAFVRAGKPFFGSFSDISITTDAPLISEGLRALAVVPVHYEGQAIAAINVASRTKNDFSAFVKQALESFASHIGGVIPRIRAEQKYIQKNQELEALNEELQAAVEELEATNEAFEQNNRELITFQNDLLISENKFRTLTENNNAPVFVVQGEKIVYANRSFSDLLGYSIDEAAVFRFWDFFHKDDRDLVKKRGLARQRGEDVPSRYEVRMLTKDGEVRWVDLTVARIEFQDDNASLVTAIDLTERKKAEKDLLMLSSAVEQAAEAMIIMRPDGTVHYVNPAVKKIFGLKSGQLIGINPFHTENKQLSLGFDSSMLNRIASGKIWRGPVEASKTDGELIELDVIVSAIFDKNGGIQNVVAVCRDVTNEIRLERELKQAQKLEAIGTLVGGIAHDFNNIIAIIMGYTELGFFSVTSDDPIYPNLIEIQSAAQRAKDLVQQILAFSRQSEQEIKPVKIKPIVSETVKFLRASLPSTIEIKLSLTAETDMVLADPVHIHQILMNLCTNAKQAMSETGGVLEISLKEETVSAADSMDLKPGSYIKLSVSDSGSGINPSILDRIFDPFFTTKKQGEGTGLGLSVVHGIVKSSGGEIKVESSPGSGSAFHIYLPSAEGSAVEPLSFEKIKAVTGTERIMVVDDEKQITAILTRMLQNMGYSVVSFNSSSEALKSFENDPGMTDLLITDQTMPELTGLTLAKKVLAINPGLPVILCSGFSETASEETALKNGIRYFLLKPVIMDELAALVRKLLDEKVS